MKQQAQKKITDIKQSPFTEMGISKEASVWNNRTHLSTMAAVIFAIALHPAILKAQGTAAAHRYRGWWETCLRFR